MSDGCAQIYEPKIGNTYRVHSGEHTFTAKVTATDEDTVTVAPHEKLGIKTLTLKRLDTKFEEWL